jgi:hypothetical protein
MRKVIFSILFLSCNHYIQPISMDRAGIYVGRNRYMGISGFVEDGYLKDRYGWLDRWLYFYWVGLRTQYGLYWGFSENFGLGAEANLSLFLNLYPSYYSYTYFENFADFHIIPFIKFSLQNEMFNLGLKLGITSDIFPLGIDYPGIVSIPIYSSIFLGLPGIEKEKITIYYSTTYSRVRLYKYLPQDSTFHQINYSLGFNFLLRKNVNLNFAIGSIKSIGGTHIRDVKGFFAGISYRFF